MNKDTVCSICHKNNLDNYCTSNVCEECCKSGKCPIKDSCNAYIEILKERNK